MKKRLFAILSVFGLLFGIVGMSSCSNSSNTLVISGKEYSEQQILAHMVAELLDHRTDIKIKRKIGLGGTPVVFAAMKKGSVDVYIEYTGTAYVTILKHEEMLEGENVADRIYQAIKSEFKEDYGMEVLDQMGFNNTYVMVVTPEFALEHNLEKISDLIAIASQLHGAFTPEFLNRHDGILGLQEAYGFEFGDNSLLEGTLRYTALTSSNNPVNITSAFATDSLIQKQGLVVLEDDLHFFPPYFGFPLVGKRAAEKFPEIIPILNELAAVLSSDEVMLSLNYQVDEEQKEPREVALTFLREQGLID